MFNAAGNLCSSDLKTEAACFAIFILLGITCQNLFANGFWNTYNRQFSDLKHLHQEVQLSETLISVTYKVKNESGKEISGKGLLIRSKETEAVIWDSVKFVTLGKTDRILNLVATRTQKTLSANEIFFSNISQYSLQKLTTNKPLLVVKIHSNTPFTYTKENKLTEGKTADLTNIVSPVFDFTIKKEAVANTSTIESRRRILLYDLAKEIRRQQQLQNDKNRISAAIRNLSGEMDSMELYDREKATRVLQKLKTELASFLEIEDNTGKIRLQIQALKSKPTAEPEPVLVSGYINILEL